jgi:hypothetical protein
MATTHVTNHMVTAVAAGIVAHFARKKEEKEQFRWGTGRKSDRNPLAKKRERAVDRTVK